MVASCAVSALSLFRQLSEDLVPAEVAALRRAVRAHFDALVVAQHRSELIALDLAERLVHGLEALFEMLPRLDASERAMVIGAARYFVADDDEQPDASSCIGLDDDVLVFNHVASALNRPDLLIEDS